MSGTGNRFSRTVLPHTTVPVDQFPPGSSPDTEFAIEVFTNSSGCLPGSFGSADAHFGSFLVNTESNGVGAFDVQFDLAANPGETILATATDPLGNTSEFSSCQTPESIFSVELDFEHGFEDPL